MPDEVLVWLRLTADAAADVEKRSFAFWTKFVSQSERGISTVSIAIYFCFCSDFCRFFAAASVWFLEVKL